MKTVRTTAAIQPVPRTSPKRKSATEKSKAKTAGPATGPMAGSTRGSPSVAEPGSTGNARSHARGASNKIDITPGVAGTSSIGVGESNAVAKPASSLRDPPKATSKVATPPSRHAVAAAGVDVLHAIYERRAVREYTGVKPSKELLKRLFDAAVQAPSAMDLQPWSFVVVQDAALLKRLSDQAKKLSLARMPSGHGLSLYRRELEDPKTDIFHGSGTLVAIVAKPGPWPGVEDCCLAGQNFMLAAHALGLGTCPIGYARDALNDLSFKRELGIPTDHSVAMAIVVGHKKDQPSPTIRHEARILGWH